MRRRVFGFTLFVSLVFGGYAAAQEIGPQAGSLVIVGGAMRDRAIVERFLDLAGGPDAPIVMIPTHDHQRPGRKVPPEVNPSVLGNRRTPPPDCCSCAMTACRRSRNSVWENGRVVHSKNRCSNAPLRGS